mmetsp:Transcript_18526/g.28449  ORF Transcript_18526/g.28449 Transcript_18526/m.28449 type:complete len:402 (+) Transcript_18526:203-1408(+)
MVMDMGLPKSYKYDFVLLYLFQWHFSWSNINYAKPKLDFKDMVFEFTEGYDTKLIKMHFPALKDWTISAHQKIDTLLFPSESDVRFQFKDFNFKMQFDLDFNEDTGYLDFDVYDSEINFGESYLYHDNKILAVIMHQIIYYLIVIFENTSYFFGKPILTKLLGPVFDRFANDFQFPIVLESPFKGQNTAAPFTIDMRSTSSPIINSGFMDAFFVGEFLYEGNSCALDNDYMGFDEYNSKFSQIVVSESWASCALENFGLSPIGKIILDTTRANQLFGREDIKIDTTFLANTLNMKCFEDEIGKHKDLVLELGIRNPKVQFKAYDSDIVLNFGLTFKVTEVGGKMKELIYDEIRMIAMVDAQSIEATDKVTAHIRTLKMDVNKYSQKSSPVKNFMAMTENEY